MEQYPVQLTKDIKSCLPELNWGLEIDQGLRPNFIEVPNTKGTPIVYGWGIQLFRLQQNGKTGDFYFEIVPDFEFLDLDEEMLAGVGPLLSAMRSILKLFNELSKGGGDHIERE